MTAFRLAKNITRMINLEELLNRMNKVEHCVIPDLERQLAKTTDVAQTAHLKSCLEEKRLLLREYTEEYKDKLRQAREDTYNV